MARRESLAAHTTAERGMSGLQAATLPDCRLHLQHGPIDLIIGAFGAPAEIARAYGAARTGFDDVLATLVSELPLLRTPLAALRPSLAGPVARRMLDACWPYRADFITPMAAVAGAVADHMLAAMTAVASLERAYVNDGGDIAFHLAPGAALTCGLVADLAAPAILGTMRLAASMPARGLATSGRACKGRGGRSFSFGIADAVTVLAASGAAADAAATIVANAVDLPGHGAIARVPACDIDPDSDLGDRPVTWDVGALSAAEVDTALAAGQARAEGLRRAGLLFGAVLVLRGRAVVVGAAPEQIAA
jgi:ApbE superfamily uncharacterized protein (UPF0280 family)